MTDTVDVKPNEGEPPVAPELISSAKPQPASPPMMAGLLLSIGIMNAFFIAALLFYNGFRYSLLEREYFAKMLLNPEGVEPLASVMFHVVQYAKMANTDLALAFIATLVGMMLSWLLFLWGIRRNTLAVVRPRTGRVLAYSALGAKVIVFLALIASAIFVTDRASVLSSLSDPDRITRLIYSSHEPHG